MVNSEEVPAASALEVLTVFHIVSVQGNKPRPHEGDLRMTTYVVPDGTYGTVTVWLPFAIEKPSASGVSNGEVAHKLSFP